MTNEEIVALVVSGDVSAKEQLCTQNEKLCRMVAGQCRWAGEHEDLMQTCYLALLEAAESFDPGKGMMFSGWAVMYMKSRIYRSSNSLIALPEYVKIRLSQYRRFLKSHKLKTGTDATDGEVMAYMMISPEELEEIRKAESVAACCSLQAELENDLTLEETVASEDDVVEDVVRAVYDQERSESIWNVVDELPQEQAETLRRHYIGGESLVSIGPKARANEAKALRSLRKNKSIYQYYEDIRSAGMRGISARRFRETWMSATERTALQDLGEL